VTEVKRMSLVKPTLQTRYHIDFEWWRHNDRDWHVDLQGFLCPEHQKMFSGAQSSIQVDWIDPETAEIVRVDGLQHILISHCARQPEFLMVYNTLVDSVFRLFLANGNTPLTPQQLAGQLNRDSNVILKTLSGIRVYKGLRPFQE